MRRTHRDSSLGDLLRAGALGGLADEDLLRLFVDRGDEATAEAAFGALVRRHGSAVLGVCRGVLRDEHAAEDAFQATFLVLARRAASVRKAGSLASWLFGVARRVSAKVRAEAARRRSADRRAAERSAGRAAGEEPEAWPEIYEELGRLPEKYRAPLVLCHLAGLTYEQAAAQLGCPVRTLQTRLIRGRERLRGRLARRGLAPACVPPVVTPGKGPARAAVPEALAAATIRAAPRFAAGEAAGQASAAVSTLAEGVIRTMMLNKLKALAAAALACFAAIAGGLAGGGMARPRVDPAPEPAPVATAAVSATGADSGPDAAGDLERRSVAVYGRLSPAVVRVEAAADGSPGDIGVIVTPEGHVLTTSQFADRPVKVRLPDGREAGGKSLGWSPQWGVALAKIDGDGPWPHAPIAEPVRVRAGQPIATFAYALNEEEAGRRPLLDLEWVDRSAPGFWFARPDGTRYEWQMRGGLAFDLDGRLLGIENNTFLRHGTIFTHVDRVRALWADLVAGGNVDQVRLRDGAGDAPPAAPRPGPVAKEAEEKAVAASVRIRFKAGEPDAFISGTIVTRDGLVATCAHHFVPPGGEVIVALPDGRDLAGEVVGLSFPADIGLVRITDPGPFPHAELGDSTRLAPGDPCLLIGYGPADRRGRRPGVRATSVVPPRDGRWSHLLATDRSARTVGGDSGGGLFNSRGELVAFSPAALSHPDWPNEHVRAELLRAQHDALRVSLDQSEVSDLAPVEEDIRAAADRARPWVVEVMDGDRPAALGTVVRGDGLILTKASALPPTPACRLADGRVLPATVRRVAREHDLATLKVEAEGLPEVRWSAEATPPVGALVAFAGPDPARGTVAHLAASIPGERGRLGATLRETERGPEVVELATEELLPEDPIFGFGPQPLEEGDVVLGLDGRPTATLEELRALLDPERDPVALAGDRVRLAVERGGERRELNMLLRPLDDFPLEGQTARRSGFARAFGVLKGPGATLFGGAVVDREGEAIGVAVAARQRGWILVVPAAVAREIVAD